MEYQESEVENTTPPVNYNYYTASGCPIPPGTLSKLPQNAEDFWPHAVEQVNRMIGVREAMNASRIVLGKFEKLVHTFGDYFNMISHMYTTKIDSIFPPNFELVCPFKEQAISKIDFSVVSTALRASASEVIITSQYIGETVVPQLQAIITKFEGNIPSLGLDKSEIISDVNKKRDRVRTAFARCEKEAIARKACHKNDVVLPEDSQSGNTDPWLSEAALASALKTLSTMDQVLEDCITRSETGAFLVSRECLAEAIEVVDLLFKRMTDMNIAQNMSVRSLRSSLKTWCVCAKEFGVGAQNYELIEVGKMEASSSELSATMVNSFGTRTTVFPSVTLQKPVSIESRGREMAFDLNMIHSQLYVAKLGKVMRRKGLLQRWKPCVLVLTTTGFCHIFESEDSIDDPDEGEMEPTITIRMVKSPVVLEKGRVSSNGNAFIIRVIPILPKEKAKEYTIRAFSAKDCDDWIGHIRNVIATPLKRMDSAFENNECL